MKLKYDTLADAIYIEFSKGKSEKIRKISDSVLVDEDKNGKVLGVEILDVKKSVPAFNPKATILQVQTS